MLMVLLWTIAVAAVIGRRVDVLDVNGTAMEPTLVHGDMLVTSRDDKKIERLDLVLYKRPPANATDGQANMQEDHAENEKYFVGRAVALPSEVVEILRGRIVVSGTPIAQLIAADNFSRKQLHIDQYLVVLDGGIDGLRQTLPTATQHGVYFSITRAADTLKIRKVFKRSDIFSAAWFELLSGTSIILAFPLVMTLLRRSGTFKVFALPLEGLAYLTAFFLLAFGVVLEKPYYAALLGVHYYFQGFLTRVFAENVLLLIVVALGSLVAGLSVLRVYWARQ